jgi:hypothetical protein
MELTWELNVIRRRGTVVMGVRRVERSEEESVGEKWPTDFMG